MALESWNLEQTSSGKLKQMVKITKQIGKERKEATGSTYAKDERGSIQTVEEDILERWRSYFETLLNEENEHELDETDMVQDSIEEI